MPEENADIKVVETIPVNQPLNKPCNITIQDDKGRQAIIDFSNGKLEIKGDLPVEQSAILFFEHVRHLLNAAIMEEAKKLIMSMQNVKK